MDFKVTFVAALAACAISTVCAQVNLGDASGWLESVYAQWAADGSDSYNVYYSGGGKTDVKVDASLVRKYGSSWRVDVPGLKAGDYTLKIAGVKGGKEGTAVTTKALSVKAHDRSGFAFSDSHVPGAYKSDGTLKDGAVVVYITESTKNSVKLAVTTDSKGGTTECTGFQSILTAIKKGYDKRPFDFRLVGNITDPDSTDKGDILVDMGKKEGASITIEGVGPDATANGWGIRIKNSQDVEVRNLGIMNVDSDEGDNIGLQQDNSYMWVHNCDFFYGDAGSDKDQVKGDGALDCKKSTYVTFSYNHFWDNGKSNLLGLSEGTTDGLYITYHHNWYDHSDSRHPRVRYYSAHVYNNYYDGIAKYGAGSTLGSSVFMESNYFRNCKYPMLTSMHGSDVYAGGTKRDPKNYGTFSDEDGGTIKAYGNHFEGSYTFIPYGASKYVLKGAETAVGSIDATVDFDAYVVDSRDAKVPSTVKSYAGGNTYNNFDTDNSVMYKYTADSPEAAKDNVVKYAGRVQGGDFKWKFDNSKDDEASEVNQNLKDSLVAYRGWDGSVIPGYSASADTGTIAVPGPRTRTSVVAATAIRYNASAARLEIELSGPFRVDILRMDGTKMFTSRSREIDLSGLHPGLYLARLTQKGQIDVKTFLR